jgi:hypothetical protein
VSASRPHLSFVKQQLLPKAPASCSALVMDKSTIQMPQYLRAFCAAVLVCHKATGRHKFQSISRPYMCSRGPLLPHCTVPSLDACPLCRSSRVMRAPGAAHTVLLRLAAKRPIVVTRKYPGFNTRVALVPLYCSPIGFESLFPFERVCSSSFKKRLRAFRRRSLFRLACPCTVRHEGGVKNIAGILIFPS